MEVRSRGSVALGAAATAAVALAAYRWYATTCGDESRSASGGDDDESVALEEKQRHARRTELRAAAQAIRYAKKERRMGTKRRDPEARQATRDRRREALLDAYGGSADAARLAARALKDADEAGRRRLVALLDGYDGSYCGGAPELEVDLSFYGSHDARGKRSVGRQLAGASAFCRRSLKPLVVTLSSYRGEAATNLAKIGAGEWPFFRDARDTWARRDARAAARVVYLTPDASEPLEGLEPGTTYVVGGLVDRVVAKDTTLTEAQLRGCDVRRLPLVEHKHVLASRGGARKSVLNIDVVLHCLLRLHENGGDWEDALVTALPDGKPTPPRI